MSTLTFLPVADKEFERLLSSFGNGDFFLELKKFMTGLRNLMFPHIGYGDNNKVLLKEGDITLSLVQLPDTVDSRLDELIKNCGVFIRAMVFFQEHYGRNNSKNRILVLSQPAKTSWIYLGHIDLYKITQSPATQKKVITDFELFLEKRKLAGFFNETTA